MCVCVCVCVCVVYMCGCGWGDKQGSGVLKLLSRPRLHDTCHRVEMLCRPFSVDSESLSPPGFSQGGWPCLAGS